MWELIISLNIIALIMKKINFLILIFTIFISISCTKTNNKTVGFNSIIFEEKEKFNYTNYKKFQNKDELAKNFLMAYETIMSFFVNPGIENLSIMDRFISTR